MVGFSEEEGAQNGVRPRPWHQLGFGGCGPVRVAVEFSTRMSP